MAAKQMPEVDYVLVGFGWTGGILANELTKAGHSVVALERGQFRDTNPDFMVPAMHDELAYAVRQKLFQNAARETVTLRNNAKQTALPVRNFIAFIPGDGVGGAGTHWNGATWRSSKPISRRVRTTWRAMAPHNSAKTARPRTGA
ncbi:MAG TPA: hypothetical protein VE591_08245 [Candidatus Acidoferrum sp.]|nr:hypothetical protein [Candidatus Acidoferrum sp.]